MRANECVLGSASAAFNIITGMDFVVHIADHSV